MTTPFSARGIEVATWLITALALCAAIPFHLLPALLAGLLVYQLVGLLAPVLARAIANQYAKLAAVALISVIVIGLLSLAVIGLLSVLRSELGGANGFHGKLFALLADARAALPPLLLPYLPADPAALEAALLKWLREHSRDLQLFGSAFGRGSVKVLIGMVIGAMVALYEMRPHSAQGPLARALRERCARFSEAFRQVVFAQFWISALNTVFTAIFLAIVLPLFGVNLPLTKTLIAVTFIAGLLPVVGNLISNTVITFVAMSVSFEVALAALGYLVVIHKLEYFLNARIVGGHINARAWEILIAMLVMESLFGLLGVLAAPIYYAYLKDELSRRGLV